MHGSTNGTAPGFVVEQKRRALPDFPITTGKLKSGDDLDGEFVFLTFPGVPAELYEMWKGDEGRAAVERYLDHTLGNNRTVYRTKLIHTFGLGESVVEAKVVEVRALDITFMCEDEEIQPLLPISVKLCPVETGAKAETAPLDLAVVHVDDEGKGSAVEDVAYAGDEAS